jgi:hypothetical protein
MTEGDATHAVAEVGSPQVPDETKLMHSYRVASAVHSKGDIVAVRNASGMLELFTTGTDGRVWNFYPDPGSDTGYRGVALPLRAYANPTPEHSWNGATMAAGVDEHGRIVVFTVATPPNVVWSVHETGQPDARWSNALVAYLKNNPSSDSGMYELFAEDISDHLFVGVAGKIPTPNRNPVEEAPFSSILAYSDWRTDSPAFAEATFPSNWSGSATWTWAGNTSESAAVVCAKNWDDHWMSEFANAYYVTQQRQEVLIPPGDGNPAYHPVFSMDAAVDAAGRSHIFGVVRFGIREPGCVAQLVSSQESAWTWQPLSARIEFRQVQVEADGHGDLQLFAVSQDDRLYHLRPDANSPTGYSEPAPLHSGTAKIAVGRNDQGNVDVFAVGRADGVLTHLFLQQDEWQHQTVEVPTSDEIEEYISHSSDVTVADAAGDPLPGEPVSVWTTSETRLTVNGSTYDTDPGHPVQAVTSGAETSPSFRSPTPWACPSSGSASPG